MEKYNKDFRPVSRAERAVLPALPRQDGHTDLRSLPSTDRGARRHGSGQALARRALRLRQVREAVPRASSLREEGPGLLRDPLSPAVWQSLLCLQSGDCWGRYVLFIFKIFFKY